MNEARKQSVRQAFDILDENKNGLIEYDDIKSIYCFNSTFLDTYSASKNPAVIEGRKTEQEVLEEFLSTFEMHHSVYVK
jgi:calcyphosin